MMDGPNRDFLAILEYASHLESQRSLASPALPAQDQLDPVFTPAEIMNAQGQILPEKVLTSGGEPVKHTSHPRPSLLEAVPVPVMPETRSDPAAMEGAAEFCPGGRPLARHASAHVFIDLSVPMEPTTEWQTLQQLCVAASGREMQPILPAPHDAMLRAGERYTIRIRRTRTDQPPMGAGLAGDAPLAAQCAPRSAAV